MRYIVLAYFAFLGACFQACVRLPTREEQGRAAAMSQAAEDISRLTAERNLYRAQSARAHELLADWRRQSDRRALAAYVKGVRDGHSTVKCLPSWPPMEVGAAPRDVSTAAPIDAAGVSGDRGDGGSTRSSSAGRGGARSGPHRQERRSAPDHTAAPGAGGR